MILLVNARRTAGFTLIEVLITVAIIATLASVAFPLTEMAVQRNSERELRRALREIRDAIDAYKRASDEGRIQRSPDQSGYPVALQTLVNGVPDAKDPRGAKLYFMRRIPRDPFTIDPDAPSERHWRLRAYDSPPDRPESGKDVFDVSSLSERVGLNGIPYREW